MSPADTATIGFRHFHDQLSQLKQRLLDMSDLATSLLDLSVDALLSRDSNMAEAVLTGDRDLDALELEVEDQAIGLLALQQPMARDLRFIIASIKVSNDLERVGDHAVNIAQSALRLSSLAEPKPLEDIPVMAELTITMLRDSVTAWLNGDAATARRICERDVEIDGLKAKIFAKLSGGMIQTPESVPRGLELLLVSRNLERVADLATNIAEEAIFVTEARVIKHHAEDATATRPVSR